MTKLAPQLDYPCLVLNRKFAGSGRPYWKAEMRFDANDVEVKDVMEQSSGEALSVCQAEWGFVSYHEVTPDGLKVGDHVLGGQRIYKCRL